MSRPLASCGSTEGYKAHRRRGEEACAPCRRASAAYMAKWRKERADLHARGMSTQNARNKALRRLARMFPEEFQTLYSEALGETRAERWAS